MTIFALTVGRNEERRYLESFLRNVNGWADKHFFMDDDSTDETAAIAARWCQGTAIRSAHPEIPPMVVDEGLFRGGAWKVFEDYMRPVDGDWIFCIDCDQMLVSIDGQSVRHSLESLLRSLTTEVAELHLIEIFGYDHDGTPMVRTDRLWGSIYTPCLFRYHQGGVFRTGRIAPGQPTYVWQTPWTRVNLLFVMHFGYADPEDWLVKYQRYTTEMVMTEPGGHASDHVASIIAPDKTLERWRYPISDALVRKG